MEKSTCASMTRKSTADVQIGIVVDGKGILRCGDMTMDVKKGDEIFFPYGVEKVCFEGSFSVILCNPGVTADYK